MLDRAAAQYPKARTYKDFRGMHKPEIWKKGIVPPWPNGALFIGEEAMLLSDYGKHIVILGEQCREFQRPQPFIPDSPGQHQEWIQACKTGTPTGGREPRTGWKLA